MLPKVERATDCTENKWLDLFVFFNWLLYLSICLTTLVTDRGKQFQCFTQSSENLKDNHTTQIEGQNNMKCNRVRRIYGDFSPALLSLLPSWPRSTWESLHNLHATITGAGSTVNMTTARERASDSAVRHVDKRGGGNSAWLYQNSVDLGQI